MVYYSFQCVINAFYRFVVFIPERGGAKVSLRRLTTTVYLADVLELAWRLPGFVPDAAGPRPADAKADEHVLLAGLQAAGAAHLVDENGDRRRDGVAAVFEHDGQARFIDL